MICKVILSSHATLNHTPIINIYYVLGEYKSVYIMYYNQAVFYEYDASSN